jgi:hypothetical protein
MIKKEAAVTAIIFGAISTPPQNVSFCENAEA